MKGKNIFIKDNMARCQPFGIPVYFECMDGAKGSRRIQKLIDKCSWVFFLIRTSNGEDFLRVLVGKRLIRKSLYWANIFDK